MTGIKNIHVYWKYKQEPPYGISYLKSFDVNVMFYDEDDYHF